MKIAIIGAGSSYTPEVVDGLLDIGSFEPLKVALYDIPEGRERMQSIFGLVQRMAKRRNSSASFEVAHNLVAALSECDFVISQIRVGQMQARMHDERMPLVLGLLGQETTGSGGFCNAMRTIPVALEIAHEMERRCPNAWLINFTNPAGIITEAIRRYSSINCVGLCNVPYNMCVDAARALGSPLEFVRLKMVGLNHLSFVTEIWFHGDPVLQRMINEGLFSSQHVKNIPKVKGVDHLIQSIRAVPSPYLQYYYFEQEMIHRTYEDVKKGIGTRAEQILLTQEDLFTMYRDPNVDVKPAKLETRGGAHYSTVAALTIQALSGAEDIEMPVCYSNGNAISGLSEYAVVETNALINSSGVHLLAAGRVPAFAYALISSVKIFESLTVEASVEHSRSKAIQALLSHPLIHGYDNAVAIVDDLLATFPEFVGKLE